MIVIECTQGTPEWHLVRLGIPTASQFHRILTPKTRKYAAGAETYRNELLADWVRGYPLGFEGNGHTERGTELEPEAREYYELAGHEVVQVGFVLRDRAGKVGCSPDALVGDDGLLELKCPDLKQHIAYLINPQSLVDEYFGQVQGNLYVTGREWADIMAYSPGLPKVVQRVTPDADYQAKLDDALANFIDDLDRQKAKLAKYKRTVTAEELVLL